MKGILRSTLILLTIGGLLQVCYGQTGNYQLTSGGSPTVTGTATGTAASVQSATGTTLTATLNFGDVSMRNPNAMVSIVMPIRISTRAAGTYRVRVQRTAIGGASGVQAANIGFGVRNFRAQITPNSLRATALSGIVTSGTFGTDPRTAPINADGQPTFSATLNNISTFTPTQIFSGPQTTSSGNYGTNGGSILADLVFVIVPQFYTPTGSFTTTLTITIGA
jgi:hypothetical protein